METQLIAISREQTTASEEALAAPMWGVDFSAHHAAWVQEPMRQLSPPPGTRIRLSVLHVSGWKLVRSLDLSVEYDGEQWVIGDDIFGVYGVGEEPVEALRDYESTLVRFYVDVVEWEGGLAPHLEVQRQTLMQYVKRGED